MSESEVPKGFTTASHAVLFDTQDARCAVCTSHLDAAGDKGDASDKSEDGEDDKPSDTDTSFRGRGLLVWARGDERRYEEPELCAQCASAIGVTALQRWEIEEDEG